MQDSRLSVSIFENQPVVRFDDSITPLKSLENLTKCTKFAHPQRDAIIDNLYDRAVSDITWFDVLIDIVASIIFCGHYEPVFRKINRLYLDIKKLPNDLDLALSDEKISVFEKNETPKENGPLDKKDFDEIPADRKPVAALDISGMDSLQKEMKEPDGLVISFRMMDIKKYADPLEAIDEKVVRRILGDVVFLKASLLNRIELVEHLKNILERIKNRPKFYDLQKYLENKIVVIEKIQVDFFTNQLKKHDYTDLNALWSLSYTSRNLISEQVGNIPLYNLICDAREKVANTVTENEEKETRKKWILQDLIECASSINRKDFSLLPQDVWENIFKFIDKALPYYKHSMWFTQFKISKRINQLTQNHVNAWIFNNHVCLKSDKFFVLPGDAISYTVKHNIKSISLRYDNLSVENLESLLKVQPSLEKLHITHLSDRMLPILYKFTKLKELSISGKIERIDLTSFECLEKLEFYYSSVKEIVFKDDDQTLKEVRIGAGIFDSEIIVDFKKLKKLQQLKIDSARLDKIEISSLVFSDLSINGYHINTIEFDENISSIKTISIVKLDKLKEFVLPPNLPNLSSIELREMYHLKAIRLPALSPALKTIHIKDTDIEDLDFMDLSGCKKIEVNGRSVITVHFPISAPELEEIDLSRTSLAAIDLPVDAPKIKLIKLILCNLLTSLTVPVNPASGASIYRGGANQFYWLEVANHEKYTEAAF